MVNVKPQFLIETIFRALKTYCGTRKYQYIFSSLCKCRCRWVYSTLEGKSGGGIFHPFGGMLLPAKTVACFREFPGNWRTRALGQQILQPHFQGVARPCKGTPWNAFTMHHISPIWTGWLRTQAIVMEIQLWHASAEGWTLTSQSV